MNLYKDSAIFDPIINCAGPMTLVPNLIEFKQCTGPKIAMFLAPFPRHVEFNHLENLWNDIYDVADCIILIVTELHDVTTDFIAKFDRPKVVFFLNGHLNFELKHAQYHSWMSWFDTTIQFYKKQEFILDRLNPYTAKPKVFDILLGQKRPHRDILYKYINDKQLNSQVVMTYINNAMTSFQSKSPDEFIWESEGIEIPDWSLRHTITQVKYFNHPISLSQIVPIDIYNQTAYSVVAETWGNDNRFSFNTEKIVKPILAKRLFLVASNQYYLQNLRKFGFKTFDGIIDESYDLEPDLNQRMNMIIEQMEYLIAQPQETILEQVAPIVEYNKQLMLTTNWMDTPHSILKNYLQYNKDIK